MLFNLNNNNNTFLCLQTDTSEMEDILQKIGLDEHETRLYLALLRIGTTTATKIATETNTDRATTYRFLAALSSRGLVSHVTKNNVKHFTAAAPHKILEDLETLQNEYREILPELESLQRTQQEDTNVEVYKGREGLKTILKDILREKQPYTFIGEVEKFFTGLKNYGELWLKKIEREGIKGRLLCTEGSHFRVAATETYRLISPAYISRISTWTYGNKTALFIWSDPLFGVLIENQEVADSNRTTFEFLWTTAKEPTRKHKLSTTM